MHIERVRFYLPSPSPLDLSRGRVEMWWGAFPVEPCPERPGRHSVEISNIPQRPQCMQEAQGIVREIADSSLPVSVYSKASKEEFLGFRVQ